MRRDPGNVDDVVELGAQGIILPFDPDEARPDRDEGQLPADLRTVENRVLLGIDDLLQFGIRAAGRELIAAERSGQPLVDETRRSAFDSRSR